ncbi:MULTISPECIES: zinc dependent phospholipase C family protein [unclassified Spirosoma]|uniref:zinc dependent phospholipase C family protein n=1 Tax=unclassified Spirosoma TaxID=2621999 RepID=UPI00096649AD|nr:MULTISPECIES: zinc dependent phospholipase C family protein [unclassified Spirosoma]MBN8822108.1 integrase [Spirosoma sp.]OJW80507.1 MAG: integrase [Spirosoma sp. 48-14]
MFYQSYNRFIWLFISTSFFFGSLVSGTPIILGKPIQNRPTWGFYAHQQINRLAVFTLPVEMVPFFKKYITYLSDNAVNPDKRRYAVVGEAPRHFIDLDAYSDTTSTTLPRYYKEATERYGADTLALHGIVPWQIQLTKYQLTEAFKERNVRRILRVAADLGHYIADANVPLHTTRNYNGQLTNQQGIHGFWESRLPELFSVDYDFLTGQAEYIYSPQKAAWRAVFKANAALDSVLRFERQLTDEVGETQKYGFEERNGVTTKVYSADFSRRYHEHLKGQVERQMRASVKMVGDFWYTCWVDAGQPDLRVLANYQFTNDEKKEETEEKMGWLKRLFSAREEN